MRRLFVLLALLCLSAVALAQSPQPAKPLRVLFIGNSLTFTGNIPSRVQVLARDMGHPMEVQAVAEPSFSLEDHWKDGAAREAIRKGWDLVVLQQGTSAHREGREELVTFTRKFSEEIRKSGARPAVYMVWPLAERPRDFPDAIRAHRAAAEAVDALLIPAGEAWLRVLSKDKRVRLYSDGIHPSSLGIQLTVLTIYLSLFPAGPQEFTEEYIRRVERLMGMRSDYTDLFFDAATLAIDQPLAFP